VGLAVARLEHRHRRLVGVQHAVFEQLCAQGIHQRLQLHAALAHPLRQRRAGDRQAGALEDALLAVQRQVVRYLATSTWASRPGGGDALVDDVRGTGACTRVSHLAQTHLPRMWRST
jgi:hypothetical protein